MLVIPHNEYFAVVYDFVLICQQKWTRPSLLPPSLACSVHLCDVSVVLDIELESLSKVLQILHLKYTTTLQYMSR